MSLWTAMDPSELPLRDIHLPPAVNWWPPAPGWWVLAGFALLAALAALWWYHRRDRTLGIDRAAAAELDSIRAEYAGGGDSQTLLREISVLMRRICITRYPRAAAAARHGEAWLKLLDELAGGDAFSHGVGQVLAAGPYQRRAEFDAEALLAACGAVIQGLKVADQAAS